MSSDLFGFFVFKQKTAYEMRISDWSSDVCSSDLPRPSCPASAATAPSPERWLSGVRLGRRGAPGHGEQGDRATDARYQRCKQARHAHEVVGQVEGVVERPLAEIGRAHV